MEKLSAPSSRERAQHLYQKNIELENKRRKSAQSRVPSDPNDWQQIRENYEAIILEDHAFSEQHNIEYALWQLHYRRIEELRSRFSAALASSQAAKGPPRPDQVAKIRLQFKTLLSEATGFYHELILKIRAKYGLPLGYFSEDSANLTSIGRDGKKSAGLVSCHRCLIYLGDLARYKGLYGEGDSRSREYAAASSYYLQAAALWPSSGNPHHQLAILASYSADDLAAVYRYFRSLAAESPFSTARDNLIVAFEKNRQSYCEQAVDVKGSAVKDSSGQQAAGKGRKKREEKLASKEITSPVKERLSNNQGTYKIFCTRFVRLNGILFTRTSLETFAEVLTSGSNDFCELLSSGAEEKLNFGADADENALFIVRIVAILIYTVNNLKKKNEGQQTYAEIMQRTVLLQNAFTLGFEFMGFIVKRCVELRDPSTSYLLPGIMIFLEWLACCPDIALNSDGNENQVIARSSFWNHCIAFLNSILSVGSVGINDEDEGACFFNMTKYEDGETENRALWEDFELRGFLPLVPAQTILDFSRKHDGANGNKKERKARVKRILAAGKSLLGVVKVDQKPVCYNSKVKKFVVGVDFPTHDDTSFLYDGKQDYQLERAPQQYVDGEDDDEVIVFKPVVSDGRCDNMIIPKQHPLEGSKPDLQLFGGPVSAHINNYHQPTSINVGPPIIPHSVGPVLPQHLHKLQQQNPKWLLEEEISLDRSLKGLTIIENGHETQKKMDFSAPLQQSLGMNTSGMLYNQITTPDAAPPSKVGTFPTGIHKTPVSRPVRHIGPPPGFSHVPPKPINGLGSGLELTAENALVNDDYSWLDGYHVPQATYGSGLINYPSHSNPQFINSSNGLMGRVCFPFPGKQVSAGQQQVVNGQQQQNANGQQQQNANGQQQQNANGQQQQPTPLSAEQYQGQSIWSGRHFVFLRNILVNGAVSFCYQISNSNFEEVSVFLVALASCRQLLRKQMAVVLNFISIITCIRSWDGDYTDVLFRR
ncbi:hypothetical protein ACFE04_008010 [Oxalis oulophora]